MYQCLLLSENADCSGSFWTRFSEEGPICYLILSLQGSSIVTEDAIWQTKSHADRKVERYLEWLGYGLDTPSRKAQDRKLWPEYAPGHPFQDL